MSKKIKLGKHGEAIARQYYKSKGFEIIIQNFYCVYGELDLVVQKNNKIKIVEVKTRRNNNFGWAEESIDDKKLDRMIKSYYSLQDMHKLTDNYEIELFIIEISAKIKIRIITL